MQSDSSAWIRGCTKVMQQIKRHALLQLHKSRQGELFLLNMYYLAETVTVASLAKGMHSPKLPDWLEPQQQQHLQEEAEHVTLLADAIQHYGGTLPASKLDWLSQHKNQQWHQCAQRYRSHFANDILVPAYAIGLCAEQMAMRVLQRHCQTIGPNHPMHALLQRICQDEESHVYFCAHTLLDLTTEQEYPQLQQLLREIRAIDRSWGIATALAQYAIAWKCTLQAKFRRQA